LIYFGAIFLNKMAHFDSIITVSYTVRKKKKKNPIPVTAIKMLFIPTF
jgi:hypothetical protein